jgi:hypothetical protein
MCRGSSRRLARKPELAKTMSLVNRLAGLWPGTLQAWLLGSPRGLFWAISFAATLNVALLATEGSPLGFVGENWRVAAVTVAWTLCLTVWVSGLRHERLNLALTARSEESHRADDSFREAQRQYLKGHWIESETLIADMLRSHSCDVEAQLLLAAIQRRTGRQVEARKLLSSLSQEPCALGWRLEIDRELEYLAYEQNAPRAPLDVRVGNERPSARAA